MRFDILGPLRVSDHDRPIGLGGNRQRALLAVLVLEANQIVSTDRLIDLLWDGQPPRTAEKSLQVGISQLRKRLGRDRIETRSPGYILHVERGELDAERFSALMTEGRFADALALWRGPALGDVGYEDFFEAEARRLEELRLVCLERRIDEDLAAGHHAELVAELERLCAQFPLRPRMRAQLMLAFYRSGREADALEVYADARRTLADDLGLDPPRELRELQQAVLNQDPSLDLPALPDRSRPGENFVGRETELRELVGALNRAFDARGGVILIDGEPGIGKSRLLDELSATAQARGARVLVGRCWEAGGAPAFWPWVQALRPYIEEEDDDRLREHLGRGAGELAQLFPELARRFPDVIESHSVLDDGARFRLFAATADVLRRSGRTRPFVLLLDDLHAADEPSLLLLRFIAREIRSTRVLVVGAYRDIDPIPSDALAQTVTAVLREPETSKITLRGLDAEAVSRFVAAISGKSADQDLVRALHAETEGNPFFLGEIIRLRAVEGDAGSSQLPETARDVIARRVLHLPDDCTDLLSVASVLGREFDTRSLARMVSRDHLDVLRALDHAAATRVVTEVPGAPARMRFAHILIREALYERLAPSTRVILHRNALAALEDGYATDLAPHLAELAHHALAAHEVEKATDYARRAGDVALSLIAYEEATRLYTTALEAIAAGGGDAATRCRILLRLGEAQIRSGNASRAKETFIAAAEEARRLQLPEELAQAALGYGGRIVWARTGTDARLVPLLEEALAALPPTQAELRARVLSRLAGALRDDPDRSRRDALSAGAVELARRSGNSAALAHALDGRCYAILGPDTIGEVVAHATELRVVAARIGDTERLLAANMTLELAAHLVGDVAAVRATLDASDTLAGQLGQPAQRWQVLGDRALIALATGRFDEARELSEQARELGSRSQPADALPVYWMQRYALADFCGGLSDVEPELRRIASDLPARPVFRCALALLHVQTDHETAARAALTSLTRPAALPFDQEWLLATSLLTEAAALVHDLEAAQSLYTQLQPWSHLNAVDVGEGHRGSVARYAGMAAATLGNWESAIEHFERAVEMNTRTGALPWLAHTQRDLAGALTAIGDSRAAVARDAADAAYHRLGMSRYLHA